MQSIKLLAAASAAALVLCAPAEARDRHYHRHHGNGAAVGAALGAGIFLGALAGTAAANAREPVYVAPPPPPPVPEYGAYYRDRGEQASDAVEACRSGLLGAARRYGAFDAEIGDIYSVRPTEFGHRVRAEVTIDYPDYSRTSVVTCRTEDGLLVSARTED